MSENQNANNVIQFPKRKEADETVQPTKAPVAPQGKLPVTPPPAPRKNRKTKAVTAGTVFAVMLATGAMNRYAFNHGEGSYESSSMSRSIASVGGRQVFQRDADWEKSMSEQLAAAKPRSIASLSVGRAATTEEKLRWGTLQEKYTIVFADSVHEIQTIVLQDTATTPTYVLDRKKFLKEYGSLFKAGFASASLKSVESGDNKTVELYTLYDKDQSPKGEVRFELDAHKRLLSLKVEPTKI